MALHNKQISRLLHLAMSTEHDELNCDDYHQKLPEFLEGAAEPWIMAELTESIRIHLTHCSCCAVEYQAVLDAVSKIEKACA